MNPAGCLTQDIDLVPAEEGRGSVAGGGHGGQGQPLVLLRLVDPHQGLGGRVCAHTPQGIHPAVCRGGGRRNWSVLS